MLGMLSDSGTEWFGRADLTHSRRAAAHDPHSCSGKKFQPQPHMHEALSSQQPLSNTPRPWCCIPHALLLSSCLQTPQARPHHPAPHPCAPARAAAAARPLSVGSPIVCASVARPVHLPPEALHAPHRAGRQPRPGCRGACPERPASPHTRCHGPGPVPFPTHGCAQHPHPCCCAHASRHYDPGVGRHGSHPGHSRPGGLAHLRANLHVSRCAHRALALPAPVLYCGPSARDRDLSHDAYCDSDADLGLAPHPNALSQSSRSCAGRAPRGQCPQVEWRHAPG